MNIKTYFLVNLEWSRYIPIGAAGAFEQKPIVLRFCAEDEVVISSLISSFSGNQVERGRGCHFAFNRAKSKGFGGFFFVHIFVNCSHKGPQHAGYISPSELHFITTSM